MIDSDKLRTMLANERTMLAYIRTSLSAWIFGLAAIKLFAENVWIVGLGWIVAGCGVMILLWGFMSPAGAIREYILRN